MNYFKAKQPIIFILFASCLIYLCNGEQIKQTKCKSQDINIERLKEHIQLKGCIPKVRVCFAIDGTSAGRNDIFMLQKQFVASVSNILSLDRNNEFSAVKYSILATQISPLTNNLDQFLSQLEISKLSENSKTAIGAAIVYCDAAVFENNERAIGTTILLGNGRSNFGGNAGTRAESFRMKGGKIIAVGTEGSDKRSLLDIVGGDQSNVIDLTSNCDINHAVDVVVNKLC